MFVTAQSFWLPKDGNVLSEYEDAFWPVEDVVARDLSDFRCAIADGATESSFSATWAKILTTQWCQAYTGPEQFLISLPLLAKHWQEEVGDTPLPWYAEEKARSGAFSSLLGIALYGSVPGPGWPAHWEAIAIGDSCLFQVRHNHLIASFPLIHSEDFNSRPFLLGTAPSAPDAISCHLRALGGECRSRDTFYLMTDALACWFLSLYEEGEAVMECIADIREQKYFANLVQEWRETLHADGRPYLRNDDVTLLRLEINE